MTERHHDATLYLRLEHEFAYHPPKDTEVAERHERVRAICLDAARQLVALVPATAERAQMLESIRLAMFWANAGIACYPLHTIVTPE